MVIQMKKYDIFYTITTKEAKKKIVCIDEFFDDGKVNHHTDGIYYLMDNPKDKEIRLMNEFSGTERCQELVQNLKKDEKYQLNLNGYEFNITVNDVSQGGFLK